MDYASKLNQKATYWGNPSPDGYGGYTYDSPELLDCHWENRNELIQDPQGREVRSEAQVYLTTDVDAEGYLALGDFTGTANPKDVEYAFEIRIKEKWVSVDATESLIKAWL